MWFSLSIIQLNLFLFLGKQIYSTDASEVKNIVHVSGENRNTTATYSVIAWVWD